MFFKQEGQDIFQMFSVTFTLTMEEKKELIIPWSWLKAKQPRSAKAIPSFSYREQCSPKPWQMNTNALFEN